MATIKQIDGRTVHQIQSGQVIVDLCSVVKELAENSIDSGATSIDVRFKNQGLDLIEVQDNGSGIAPANYATVARKHHTSKLSTYADIASLDTFGFRGEALASLCGLSILAIVTCLAQDAPKGTKLTFEPSGDLRATSVVAAQRGTTVSVEKLFHNLPVRRRELERNIKREYQKVIALLNQYACIQTNVKFSVSQQPTKGKRILLFSTKGNQTTRDNIINIFGAKTMQALVPLDLELEMQPTAPGPALQSLPETKSSSSSKEVRIVGHVSRPAHGEGRQTPDRQMFFVNGRPCGLPQFAKTFNEVYRSYNSSQSPFIFADIRLDTHMYDVNVSPDKRSILLHDQGQLLDTLRSSLIQLFDTYDHTVPVARPELSTKTPSRARQSQTPVSENRSITRAPEPQEDSEPNSDNDTERSRSTRRRVMSSRLLVAEGRDQNLISQWVSRDNKKAPVSASEVASLATDGQEVGDQASQGDDSSQSTEVSADDEQLSGDPAGAAQSPSSLPLPVKDFNKRLAEFRPGKARDDPPSPDRTSSSPSSSDGHEPPIPAVHPLKMGHRGHDVGIPSPHVPKRSAPVSTPSVCIGESQQASSPRRPASKRPRVHEDDSTKPTFGKRLSSLFSAARQSDERLSSEDEGSKLGESCDEEVREDDLEESDASDYDPDHEATQSRTRPDSDGGSSQGESDQASELNNALPVHTEPRDVEVPHKDEDVVSRTQSFLGASRRKDTTLQLRQHVRLGEDNIHSLMDQWTDLVSSRADHIVDSASVEDITAPDAEAKLPLIISREDFGKMRIIGQFNLGFIIAVRPAGSDNDQEQRHSQHDELFIIDQHASDEKYNFERLQEVTVVQSQRLVHPKSLQLTALEEEIALQHMDAIESNGFKVDVDMSGDKPVGSRCQLVALPLSRETAFNLSDLEELISLLGDAPSESTYVPRPSKVRKMFAMRACRSSIMIGKALTRNQMHGLVRHMGEMDKPWNCPHGRPTMRHLCQLQAWEDRGWLRDVPGNSASSWSKYVGDG